MRNQPDYVGSWNRAKFGELPDSFKPERLNANEVSLFYIFIESENGNKFNGISRDYYGTAMIEGSKSSGFIRFTKKYDKEAVENGGRKGIITYRAVRTTIENPEEEFFAGIITSKKTDPLPFIMKSIL